jgi:predicted esterase
MAEGDQQDFLEHHVSFEKSGRYFTHGNPARADTLIIALHGYAQLARTWIQEFSSLDTERYYVVCAEGPHRFYAKGRRGDVAASWMTSEDRLNDIKDYVNFLDNVYKQVVTHGNFKRKILLGFSQGGATASRWIELGKHDINIFILWGSVFPPDLEQKFDSPLDTTANYFVIGNNDEYFDKTRRDQQIKMFAVTGMKFEFVTFDGNHRIDIETLRKLLS